MFVYLSKKIAIPHGLKLNSVAWNTEQGWIACGGANGLLKVLKLDAGTGATTTTGKDGKKGDKGTANGGAGSNLQMNQTLEGHNGAVELVVWNENYRKLTSSDEYGMIIVWMLHKGMWYEEMINNRNKSVVTDMKWTIDGTKICIIYEDGAIIVGSVDGNRLWGKELQLGLSIVEWSPSGQYLLFVTTNQQQQQNAVNEICVYDYNGNYITKIPNYTATDGTISRLVAVQWYSGLNGLLTVNCPTLACCYENGRIQILRDELDDYPILIDTGLNIITTRWNDNGSILAVAGYKSMNSTTTTTNGIEPTPSRSTNNKLQWLIQFYTPFGQHLRTLKVPAQNGISSITWENGSLRLALAVDSFLYFANIRPTYLYTYLQQDSTFCYAYNCIDRIEQCVIFYDTMNDQKIVKYIKDLKLMFSSGEYCCFITRNDTPIGIDLQQPNDPSNPNNTAQHIPPYCVILCNSIGNPIDSKYIEFEPTVGCMTDNNCVVVGNSNYLYCWQFLQPTVDSTTASTIGHQHSNSSSSHHQLQQKLGYTNSMSSLLTNSNGWVSQEQLFYIDDLQTNILQSQNAVLSVVDENVDPVVAVTASPVKLLIARASGLILQFKLMTPTPSNDPTATTQLLPVATFECSYTIPCRAATIALNCDATRLSVIDINGICTLYDITQCTAHLQQCIALTFERRDIWNLLWSTDNPVLFTVMEKNKMYIIRDTEPEEPITSHHYLLAFNDLIVTTINLDELYIQSVQMNNQQQNGGGGNGMNDTMNATVNSLADYISRIETKSLRDTRQLLQTPEVPTQEILHYLQQHSHPKLWRLVADYALQQLYTSNNTEKHNAFSMQTSTSQQQLRFTFEFIEMCYIYLNDYYSIDFLHSLQLLVNPYQRRAEIAVYLKRFDEAEQTYLQHDLPHLALSLRQRLGDWFRVVQLIQQYPSLANDTLLLHAYNEIGEYYYERQRYSKAMKFYRKANNLKKLSECAYLMDDYQQLTSILDELPVGDVYCTELGGKFQSVGLCTSAVQAYLKANQSQRAIDCCITLNQWDQALVLAERYNYSQINTLLSNYATYLLQHKNYTQAIVLYQKAKKHHLAAQLIVQMEVQYVNDNGGSVVTFDALRSKKLYLLAAIEGEAHKFNTLNHTSGSNSNTQLLGVSQSKQSTMDALSSLLLNDNKKDNNLLASDADSSVKIDIDQLWHGAEAYHFYALATRQLVNGQLDAALRTAIRLQAYDDLLSQQHIYHLLAYVALVTKHYATASSALRKLETLSTLTPEENETYKQIAVSIFIENSPVDPTLDDYAYKQNGVNNKKRQAICSNTKIHCQQTITDSSLQCDSCGKQYTACIASGRAIITNNAGELYTCRTCKHKAYDVEIKGVYENCPLCHTPIR